MGAAGTEVAVERLRRGGAERARLGASTLGDDEGDVLLEVDVVDGEVGQFGEADPGVGEQEDDGQVATVLERLAAACIEQPTQGSVVEDGDGTSGTAGGFIRAIGDVAISPSSSSQRNSCWRRR